MNSKTIQISIKQSPLLVSVYRVIIVMLLFSICRLLFYLFNRGLFPGIDSSQLSTIFLAGIRFDLTAVLYFNVFYLIIMAFPHRQHYKKWFIRWTNLWFYITNGLALSLNCIDFIYYQFTKQRTTFMVFDEFKNETNYLQLLGHFLVDYYYVWLIFIALVLGLVFLTRKVNCLKPRLSGWRYYIINAVLFPVVIILTVIGARGGLPPKQDFPLNPSDAGQYVEHPNDIALVLNTPFTMILSSDKPAYPVVEYYKSEEELNAIYSPIHQPDTTREKNTVNVVVIMVESLGRETIGFYNQNIDNGNYKGYTPFLDSLCEHSYVFMNSYSNSKISIEGTPAIAASIPSMQKSFTVSLYYANKITSLAKCLKDMGYQTYYFHGAPNGSLGLNSFAKQAGFEHYVGKTEYNNDDDFDGVWGIWDHLFLPFVAEYLNKVDTPFFSYIFTTSSHHPHKIPEHLKDKLPEGKKEIHKSIAYADYSLRKFFDYASKQTWFNNTLFVITGDHICRPYYPKFKTTVGDFTVPIIFYRPGDQLVGVDSALAQQIDIMPTVLNYVGYDKPYFAYGRDAFGPDSARFSVNYVGNTYQIIRDEWVLQYDLEKTKALYNLKTDPLLKKNLVKKNLPIQKTLERQVKAFIQQYNYTMVNNEMVVNP